MSLKALETRWKTALTSILEQLTEPEFKKMLFDLDRIPQGVKSGKVREEMPQIIIQYFGTEGSITVVEKEMKQIPRMDAAVQDKLRPFVDKLKKQQQKKKEAASKAAAGQQKSCKPEKADPVEPVKPKQRKSQKQDLSQKPAGSTKTSTADPVEPVKLKQTKTQKQDSSQKPAGSTKTSTVTEDCLCSEQDLCQHFKILQFEADPIESDPVEPVKPKQRKTQKQDLSQKPAGSTKTSTDDPVEPVKPKQRKSQKQDLSQKPAESTKTSTADPVEPVKPKQRKTQKQDLSQKPAGSTKTSTVQSAGSQSERIEIEGIAKATKTETHLEAFFRDEMHRCVVASRLLAKAFGFDLDGDIEKKLLDIIPVSADAVIQGGKIKKLTAAPVN
ncbi:uncharacterized protein AB9X84_019219 isoform 2-T2 [Acanthopagrus schlegelii]